jgi:hypothetical protein
MEKEFDILAAKVLADEASPHERRQLEEILAASPQLREEFEGMKSAWESLTDAHHLVEAIDAASEEIPGERLAQLQKVVRNKFGQDAPLPTPFVIVREWLRRSVRLSPASVSFALLVFALLAAGVFIADRSVQRSPSTFSGPITAGYLVVDKGKPQVRRAGRELVPEATTPLQQADEISLAARTKVFLITVGRDPITIDGPTRFRVSDQIARATRNQSAGNQVLAAALFLPVDDLLSSNLLVTTRSSQSIPLYSPVGATANLTPLIHWKGESDKTYDIIIADEFDRGAKPFQLTGVSPPVKFAEVAAWQGRQLAANALYRLVVRQTGQPLSACEYTFRTLDAPGAPSELTPAEKLARAFRILSAESSRVGDALAELLTLPQDFAESDLALRLKLSAFGQLGYREDFDTITARLKSNAPVR